MKKTEEHKVGLLRRSALARTHEVIVQAMLARGGSAFPADIVGSFSEVHTPVKNPAAQVGVTMARMEKQGLLSAEEAPQEDARLRVRVRKKYTVTDLAKQRLEETQELADALEQFLANNPDAAKYL